MPTNDTKIGRMNGRHLILTEDGYQPLNGIKEVEITEEPPELDIDGRLPCRIVPEPTKFSGSIELTEEASDALRSLAVIAEAVEHVFKQVMKVLKKMVDTCPNRRVVHLAKHGSPRVRKKNAKRLVRYYAKLLKRKGDPENEKTN